MSGKTRILMVDDDPNVLSGYRRTLGRKYDMLTAEGGQAALKVMDEQEQFPVVITDMRMPEMDGVAFVCAARRKHRDTVYVMLTGNADQQTAIDAINKGQIFRFLSKPCPQEIVEHTVESCVRQYELVQGERVLLRETLTGSVRLLVEAVMLSDPALGKIITTVRRDVQSLSDHLGVAGDWRLPIAASLCLFGCMVAPEGKDGRALSEAYLAACAELGANLLRHIPRLEPVAQIIARQRERGRLPDALDSNDPEARVVIGARMLRFVIDLNREPAGDGRKAALLSMRARAGEYDERLLAGAEQVLLDAPGAARPEVYRARIEVRLLRPGMTVDENVVTIDDKLLLAKGHQLSPMHIERIRSFAKAGLLAGELTVLSDEPVGDVRKSA